MIRQRTLIVVQIVAAIIEKIHEESKVFQEQLRLGFHQIASVAFLGLKRKRMSFAIKPKRLTANR